jgi:ketosteroid isomerase-like protein
MRRSAWISFLLCFASVAWLSAASAADARLGGDVNAAGAVWSTFERWLRAYDQADLDRTMAIFDPGVVFIFQGSPDQSYADLRKGYEDDFRLRAKGTRWVPLVDEVYAEGNLAFVRATWELRVAAGGDAAREVKARNRSLDILQLSGGAWHIIRSFNFPEK